jgi:hypothetical protein
MGYRAGGAQPWRIGIVHAFFPPRHLEPSPIGYLLRRHVDPGAVHGAPDPVCTMDSIPRHFECDRALLRKLAGIAE